MLVALKTVDKGPIITKRTYMIWHSLRMKVLLAPLCALMLACVGCDGGVYADGSVRNQNGDPISGATVLLRRAGGWTFTGLTNADGCFWLGGVTAPGRYEYSLTVQAKGYRSATDHVRTIRENHLSVILAAVGSSSQSSIETHISPLCGGKSARPNSR